MTGKTLTTQDVALGNTLLLQMPLQAMSPQDKQDLIERKKLLSEIASFAFSNSDTLIAAMKETSEIEIWSSESLEVDPFEKDESCDSVELWYLVRYEGLTPFVTKQLRFIKGVYTKTRVVVTTVEQDEYEDAIDNVSVAISFNELQGFGSYCAVMARIVEGYAERLKGLKVTDFWIIKPNLKSEETEPKYVIETNEGEIPFY
jgi:hypothetical protein